MLSHEYFDFFAERRCCEEQMVKMARAMGREDAASGKDFISALDDLIQAVGCADLAMSEFGIMSEELADATRRYHEVRGGNPNGDPVKLTDDDIYGIYERSYR
jgi:alcohol dehydrogenase